MKTIVAWIVTFIKVDFHWLVYLYTAVFLTIALYLNYQTNTFWVLFNSRGSALSIFYYCMFYAAAYYGIALPQAVIRRTYHSVTGFSFWYRSAFLIVLLAIISSGSIGTLVRLVPLSKAATRFLLPLSFYLQFWLVVFIPLLVARTVFARQAKKVSAVSRCVPGVLPYLLIVVLLVPAVIWASFRISFQLSYPVFKPWLHDPAFGLNLVTMALVLEVIYLSSYFVTELLFRGAMTIGLKPVLGRNVILPMVAVYVFSHFGKPPAEAIGSVFAGYVLGCIAYTSNSISGAVLVHIGTALAMEIAAYLQHYYRYFS